MRIVARIFAGTLFVIALAACSGGSGGMSSVPEPVAAAGGQAQSAATAPVSTDLGAYVSPQLAAGERQYVQYYLNALPEVTKAAMAGLVPDNVHVAIIDGATNTIHYNQPADAGTVERVERMSLPGDDYPLDGTFPAPVFNPGVNGASGPYRRDYTPGLKANPNARGSQNAYYDAASVSVACKAGSFVHTSKQSDVGFLYLGGWSASPSALGGAVDAGLQYNYKLSSSSKDDYSPFIAISKVAGYVASGVHVPCGNPAFLEFEVLPLERKRTPSCTVSDPTCPTYALAIAAFRKPFAYAAEYISPSVTQGGWADEYSFARKGTTPGYLSETPCGGCVFKFMTSIGQTPKANYTDGSSYKAMWSHKEIACAAVACNSTYAAVPLSKSLTNCSEYPLWQSTYDAAARDCTNTPANLSGQALSVDVSQFSFTDEVDSITLTH